MRIMRHIGGEDFEILAYAFLHTSPPQYFFDAQLAAIKDCARTAEGKQASRQLGVIANQI